MFTSNVSKILLVLLVLAVTIVTASFATHSNGATSVDRSYDRVEQLRSLRPNASTYDVIEQVRIGRTYNISMGRSYDGVEQLRSLSTDVYTALGFQYDPIEQLRLDRISNDDHFYDEIESLRLSR